GLLVGLAGADDAVARPDRGLPLPLFDDLGVGLLDQRPDPAERLAPPVVELGDPLADQLGRGRSHCDVSGAFHGGAETRIFFAPPKCRTLRRGMNAKTAADSHDLIRVQGARENNLKDVSVEIPKRRLTVFTGVSGSGKSSLVFGTIAAESQRLINET